MNTDNPNLKALLKEVIRSLREDPTKWKVNLLDITHQSGRIQVSRASLRHVCYMTVYNEHEPLHYTPGWLDQWSLSSAYTKCRKFHRDQIDADLAARRKAKLWRADQTAKEILKEGL